MLDYNFPPFSVGECKPIRGPGRREIGHGMLAERSLKAVIPPADEVPVHDPPRLRHPGVERLVAAWRQRVRRDAGADGRRRADQAAGRRHLDRPGQGEGQVHVLLTDIMGDEDHFGDMDFKVAGTQKGITGIQLDLKIDGIDERDHPGDAGAGPRGPAADPQDDARARCRPRGRRSARTPRGC